ncbi:MAG: TonB-dependent receptor [Proteobacteria bacterium]|nr:TonB-dependent receptor [Pseudomonadota bacterium]
MGSSYLIRRACALALAMGGALTTTAGPAWAADPAGTSRLASFDIKPQPLAAALSAFALQTHQQILFTPEIVKGKTTQGVSGALSADSALKRLLEGTGLVYRRSSEGLILVSTADPGEVSATSDPPGPPSGGNISRNSAAPAQSADDTQTLQEVIVTATGRRQSIQDVPYNISAVSGETLAAAGITDFYALAKSVPGLAVADSGPRGGLASNLIIRGISVNGGATPQFPDSTQPAVSTYIDSTPIFANLRISDLDRVEVLRGPQGTLYGANSSGGTIRLIYNQPSLDSLSAKVSAGAARTQNASGLDYNTDLTLNVPIAEQFAVRLNVGQERNAGFIAAPDLYVRDATGIPVPANPNDLVNSPALYTSAQATNWDRTTSARLSGRWHPNDVFDAKLTYQYQVQDSGGPQQVSYQAFGTSPQTSSQIREPFHSTVHFAALETETHLGFATLTTSSSHFQTRAQATNDFTGFYYSFDFFPTVYGNSPRFLAEGIDANISRGFVQEVRLASDTAGPLKWVTGAFYENRHTITRNQQYVAGYTDFFNACSADPTAARNCGLGTFYPDIPSYADGRVINSKDFAYLNNADQKFSDAALYAELEWSITPQWRLTGGVRGYRQTTTNNQVGGLLFLGPTGVGGATLSQAGHGTLAKIGTSYDLAANTMIYTLFSQGIRPAGINGLPTNTYDFNGAPTPTPTALFSYRSDRINNFEVGLKGRLLSRLDYTLTYFDMHWKDVQLGTSVTALQIGSVINAGDARSRGAEMELNGHITQRLSASIGYTYVDAKLTSVNPPTGVPPTSYSVGAHLLGVPDQLASVGLQYAQPLFGDALLTYDLSGSYRGRSSSALLTVQDTPAGGFWTIDPSLTFANGPWSARFYVRNIANKLGVYGYTPQNWGNWAGAAISRPRTVGLRAEYNWR